MVTLLAEEIGMRNAPLSITIIGCLFVVAGAVGLVYHATEFKAGGPLQYDAVWVCLLRLVAIICGAFMLRGNNLARSLLLFKPLLS
jgi:hypothetical protein